MPLPTDNNNSYARRIVTATFQDDASISDPVDLSGGRVVAIAMPSTWDAAAITFQAAWDGTTYEDVTNDAGTELSIVAAASKYIWLSSDTQLALSGVQNLKVRSGTSGAPVAQTTGTTRLLQLVVAPA